MSRKFDVTAVIGKYTDAQGQEKSRYLTIGAVIETRNGLMLKLDAVPVGWEGFAYLNEPKAKEGGQQTQQRGQGRQAPRGNDFGSDEPPF